MLEQMVKQIIRKTLATDFSYLQAPAVMLARIESASQLAVSYEAGKNLKIHNDETGSSYEGHITAHWYEYRLTVLDRFGNEDTAFPALPGIRSRKQFKAGAVVAVALPYGDLVPAIIGEVEL